jgi:phosphohistidine phosphatase
MGPVELYLVRHAIAAAQGPEWPDDALRPLTDRGISRFKKAVAGLAALNLAVDVVLTSPLVRARQTADLLAHGLAKHPPVRVVEALAPGHDPARVMSDLTRGTRARRVALVGHQPDMGELVAFLIGAERALPVKKGGVSRVDLRSSSGAPYGTLVWHVTPRILRRLGR